MILTPSNDFTTTVTSTPVRYFAGLDLGQVRDFSAVAVLAVNKVRRECGLKGTVETSRRAELVYLSRWPLGTSYPAVVEGMAKLMASLPASPLAPVLLCDATGVGRPVVDLLKRAGLKPIACTITGGANVTGDGSDYRLPKRDMVAALQVALQAGELKIAAGMAETDNLINELQNFKLKHTAAGNETFEAMRESIHDDLVFATGLANWYSSLGLQGMKAFRLDFMSR